MQTDAHADHMPGNATDNGGASDRAGEAERPATGDPHCNRRKPDVASITKFREQINGE